MWSKHYRDYPEDESLVKHRVLPGKGITGCEMHELNGWGEKWHVPRQKKKKPGLFRTLLTGIFSIFK